MTAIAWPGRSASRRPGTAPGARRPRGNRAAPAAGLPEHESTSHGEEPPNDVGHVRQFAEARSQYPSVDSFIVKGATRTICHGEQTRRAGSFGDTDASNPSHSLSYGAFSSSRYVNHAPELRLAPNWAACMLRRASTEPRAGPRMVWCEQIGGGRSSFSICGTTKRQFFGFNGMIVRAGPWNTDPYTRRSCPQIGQPPAWLKLRHPDP